jgi:hypothetical protein
MLYCHCFRICNQEGPRKSAGTGNEWSHQLLVYADDVNIMDENINTIKKNKETLLYVS